MDLIILIPAQTLTHPEHVRSKSASELRCTRLRSRQQAKPCPSPEIPSAEVWKRGQQSDTKPEIKNPPPKKRKALLLQHPRERYGASTTGDTIIPHLLEEHEGGDLTPALMLMMHQGHYVRL